METAHFQKDDSRLLLRFRLRTPRYRSSRPCRRGYHRDNLDEIRWSEPDWGYTFFTRLDLAVGVRSSELNEMEQHHGNTSLDRRGNSRYFWHCRDLSPPANLGHCAHRRGTAGWSRWCEPLRLRPRTSAVWSARRVR